MARKTDAMRMKCALLVALVGLFATAADASDRTCIDDAPVCIESIKGESMLTLVAKNGSDAPYSIRVTLEEHGNLEPSMPLPFRAVIKSGSQRAIGSFSYVHDSETTRHRFRLRAALGSALARPHARHQYRMPFGGASARILSQGVGGRHSHRGKSRWSFDFAMPWGTPVLAARAGTVVEVLDGRLASGTAPLPYHEANRVTVLHADGTLGMYAHLRHGIPVQAGERVETGHRLGSSGDTGLATGPHLHFMVWKREADLSMSSVPIRFHDGSAQGMVPTMGATYAAACSTSGVGCAPGELPPEESRPAAQANAEPRTSTRRADGACLCANGAVIHVDLPCSRVCGS